MLSIVEKQGGVMSEAKTVGDLIEMLRQYDPKSEVVISGCPACLWSYPLYTKYEPDVVVIRGL